jgi:hypothetical protein
MVLLQGGQVPPYNPLYITKLLRNYRSHLAILALPNRMFCAC